jgi:DNA-binding PadR family transcriptional regulator
MYFTDKGIEELRERRGEEQVAISWLAERLRDFVDLNPEFETAIDRLATWIARLDEDDDDPA